MWVNVDEEGGEEVERGDGDGGGDRGVGDEKSAVGGGSQGEQTEVGGVGSGKRSVDAEVLADGEEEWGGETKGERAEG